MDWRSLTRFLYRILDHMTPVAWQSATVAVLSGLSVLAIWQSTVIGMELFKIFLTMLVTGLVGLVGLVYRRMNEEIKGNRKKVGQLQRKQNQMLRASLKLWSTHFPDASKDALEEYRNALVDEPEEE